MRRLLRTVLEDGGYTVQTAPDTTIGLQVLRTSATPMTVLCDVEPIHRLAPEHNGVALLQALAHYDPESERLARHGYVLMSTYPKHALAATQIVPLGLNLRILPMPFQLDSLRACLEQVDQWLRTHPLPLPFTCAAEHGVDQASATVTAAHRVLGQALDRLDRLRQSSEPPLCSMPVERQESPMPRRSCAHP
jgi:CheY-like chemotaxis protein